MIYVLHGCAISSLVRCKAFKIPLWSVLYVYPQLLWFALIYVIMYEVNMEN